MDFLEARREYPDTELSEQDERSLQRAHEIIGGLIVEAGQHCDALREARELIGNVLAAGEE